MSLKPFRALQFNITIGVFCILMSYIRTIGGKDFMMTEINGLSGYAWSHMGMYTIMGYVNLMGDKHPYEYALALSILWETMEYVFGKSTGTLKYWTSGGFGGQSQDIVLNMTGFAIGRNLGKVFPCKINNCSSNVLSIYEIIAMIVLSFTVIRMKI